MSTTCPLGPTRRDIVARVDRIAIGPVLPRDVARRQEQRERAALALRTLDAYLAAEEAGDLTTDGKAEARSTVFAAGGSVCLRECLENQFLFVPGDSHTGICNRERDNL